MTVATKLDVGVSLPASRATTLIFAFATPILLAMTQQTTATTTPAMSPSRSSRATRNLRSVAAAAATLYDYKVASRWARTPEQMSAIHDRVAERWYGVCARNGGLYVKLGQSVTTLAHILPPGRSVIFQSTLSSTRSLQ